MNSFRNRLRFARVIIVDQHARVLVVRQKHRNRQIYCFPGGKVEEHETPQMAAAREIYEELGIKKRPESLRPALRSTFEFSGCEWIGFFYLTAASGFAPDLIELPKVNSAEFVSIESVSLLEGDSTSLGEVLAQCQNAVCELVEAIRAEKECTHILKPPSCSERIKESVMKSSARSLITFRH